MNYAKQIPAFLLGLVFLVFGAMYFLNMMPKEDMGPMVAKFFELFGPTGYMNFIKACEVVFGALLLIPKTRALGLILIAPIVVNIVCFEMFIVHKPQIGIVLLLLNIAGLFLAKDKYKSII